MAWTLPTGLFFAGIAMMLIVMSVLAVRRPGSARRGWLGFSTTRGDRLFMGLLAIAFIHVLWLAVSDMPVWFASALALVVAAGIMKKG
jgi:predicted small integral membrane protein